MADYVLVVTAALNHKRNGCFVKIGGRRGSTADVLENQYGWSGIIVDPIVSSKDTRRSTYIAQDLTEVDYLHTLQEQAFPHHLDYLDIYANSREELAIILEKLCQTVFPRYYFATMTIGIDGELDDDASFLFREMLENNGYTACGGASSSFFLRSASTTSKAKIP